jgi:hypothetical protein
MRAPVATDDVSPIPRAGNWYKAPSCKNSFESWESFIALATQLINAVAPGVAVDQLGIARRAGCWTVVSALEDTADPLVFRAPDYDTLVDQPTQMGHFEDDLGRRE